MPGTLGRGTDKADRYGEEGHPGFGLGRPRRSVNTADLEYCVKPAAAAGLGPLRRRAALPGPALLRGRAGAGGAMGWCPWR